jgi:hypothetical protein
MVTIEYEAVAVGTFLLVAILVWMRSRRIETQLGKMREEIDSLHQMQSTLFVMGLNANSKVEAPKIEPARIDAGEVVRPIKQSPSTIPAPPVRGIG